MSYYYDESYEYNSYEEYADAYEQYEAECEWYEEEVPSCNTSYNFKRNEDYSYDFKSDEYECVTPTKDNSMSEFQRWRAKYKTLPQQYQKYQEYLASSKNTQNAMSFEYYAEHVFENRPKNEDVELVKKGLCPSCKNPW
ncbi:MAG: hypothetical protein ABSC21_24250, partial [Terriglobia bacterium]